MARDQELFDAIARGDRKTTKKLVTAAVDREEDVEVMLADSMIPAMRHVGDRFGRNEIYVPEMLIAARAMQAALDIIEPILADTGHEPVGKICIGTVMGDLHDIGKNLVVIMLKGAGYEVLDLGTNCDVKKYQAAVDEGAKAVCCSALLTTTMPYMKEVVNHFLDHPDTPVFIGGAPVSQGFADEIKADGYAEDASKAVQVISGTLGITV